MKIVGAEKVVMSSGSPSKRIFIWISFIFEGMVIMHELNIHSVQAVKVSEAKQMQFSLSYTDRKSVV